MEAQIPVSLDARGSELSFSELSWYEGSPGSLGSWPPAACGPRVFHPPFWGHPGHPWPVDSMAMCVALEARAWSHLLGTSCHTLGSQSEAKRTALGQARVPGEHLFATATPWAGTVAKQSRTQELEV